MQRLPDSTDAMGKVHVRKTYGEDGVAWKKVDFGDGRPPRRVRDTSKIKRGPVPAQIKKYTIQRHPQGKAGHVIIPKRGADGKIGWYEMDTKTKKVGARYTGKM